MTTKRVCARAAGVRGPPEIQCSCLHSHAVWHATQWGLLFSNPNPRGGDKKGLHEARLGRAYCQQLLISLGTFGWGLGCGMTSLALV